MSDIAQVIEDFAPPNIAADWDNVGLLLGRGDADASKVLLALDVTDEIVAEALEAGVQAIITHHPLMRDGTKAINDKTPFGRRMLTLAENKIAVYSAHTNLDFCTGGVNDELAKALGLENVEPICKVSDGVFAGRAGVLHTPTKLSEFAKIVQKALLIPVASYVGDSEYMLRKVGVMGGGGANKDFFRAALEAGCDAYVSSDIKYSMALAAKDMGLNLVDGTHYGTEMIFVSSLKKLFTEKLPKLELIETKINGQPLKVEV